MRLAWPGPDVGFAVPRLLSSCVPLTASPLEYGSPGNTTPGIFRPWRFSSLRRFAPPDGSPALFHTGTTYGIQRTFAMFYLLCSPCGSIHKGRAFPEHKNRTRRQQVLKSTKDSVVSCSSQLALDSEELSSNPKPMCHSPGCLQAVNRGGGHNGKLKLPSSCRFVCLVLNVVASYYGVLQAVHQRRSRQRARGSLHDDGYRPPQPVATGSTARTAKSVVFSKDQTPAPLTSLLFFVFEP